MALVHSPDQHLPLRSGLRLYAGPLTARRPHRRRVHDPPRQRPRELRHRRLPPPRKEPQGQDPGPRPDDREYGFPVPGIEIKFIKSLQSQFFYLSLHSQTMVL